jgi:hypothetical protein
VSTALDCRVERGPVVIRIGSAALPAATVEPELPGLEYVRVFDLVHAAVLRWSPNVIAAGGLVPGLAGDVGDCPLEDAIDALTYGLAVHRSELAGPTGIDPYLVAEITSLAGRGSGVPTSAELWTNCLQQCLEIHDSVSTRPISRLVIDIQAGRVQLWSPPRPPTGATTTRETDTRTSSRRPE